MHTEVGDGCDNVSEDLLFPLVVEEVEEDLKEALLE